MKQFLIILLQLSLVGLANAQTPTLDSAGSLSKEFAAAIKPEYTKWINDAVADYLKQEISPDSIRSLIVRQWGSRLTTNGITSLYYVTMMEYLRADLAKFWVITQDAAKLAKSDLQAAYERYRQAMERLRKILYDIDQEKKEIIDNLRA